MISDGCGSKNLLFFGPKIGSVKRNWFFHRCERKQLEQVILDNITGSTDAIIVSSPRSHPDILGHSDLYMVDMVPIPNRFPKLICKAQSKDILHRLFTQIVIDTEH